jgi:serine/threonine protein kinase/tetratricopeptide (TPR) repeat protein
MSHPSDRVPGPVGIFTPDDIVAGRYRVVRQLGSGGMGEVYEAVDLELNERIALKRVRSHTDDSLASDSGLIQELQLARRISHPNVCRLYHIDRDRRGGGDVMFITMELLDGGTLANLLAKGPLQPDVALAIARQVAAAIDAAHAHGVIHRDLKPSNIMFGDNGRAVITDFGLARRRPEPDDVTATATQPAGTLAYMAPELVRGGRATSASDVYAFGVVMHEMITGRKPVSHASSEGFVRPSALSPDIPESWDRAILGCLEPLPGERTASADAAVRQVGPGSARSRDKRTPSRALGLGVLGSAAAMTAVLVGWLAWSNIDAVLHPLPKQRFVALMAWPSTPTDPSLPIVRSALDAISSQLSRAEATGAGLMVISSNDVAGVAALKGPTDAVRALGANLVLTAALRPADDYSLLDLAVLDATTAQVLRRREVRVAKAEVARIPERAAMTAAALLDVPVTPGRWKDQDELASVPANAYGFFTTAEEQAAQPNDSGLDQAIASYQKAIDIHPQFAYAYARLSLAFSRKFNRFRDRAVLSLAQRNADLAIRYNTQSMNAVLARAMVQLYSGNAVAALGAIQHALDDDPGNPQLLIAQARAFRYLARPTDEESVYRELIRNRPNFWPAYNELGLLLFRQAKYQEAADAFSEGAAVAPTVARLLTNLGAMQLSMKRNAEAAETFQRSLELSPTETAYNNLGTIAFAAGRYREALEFYQHARELNPRSDVVWRNIADCYTMLGQPAQERESYAKAAELVTQTLAVNAKRGPLWMQLAFYNAKLGRRTEAEAALKSADTNGANDLQSQFRKAQVLVLVGRRPEALDLLLKCLDQGLAPADVELALDLKDLRTDPRYVSRVSQLAKK